MAASIDLRTYASLEVLPDEDVGALVFDFHDLPLHAHVPMSDLAPLRSCPSSSAFSSVLLNQILAALAITLPSPSPSLVAALYLYLVTGVTAAVHITVRSAIPVGSGLGSSASFSAVLAALYLQLQGGTVAKHTLNDLAFLAECVLHGNPSGIDNTIVTMGGALLYAKAKKGAWETVDLGFPIDCLLVDTKVPKHTGTMVARVRALYEAYPGIVSGMFESIDAITLCAVGGTDVWARCIRWNQRLLENLEVSHRHIDTVVTLARDAGLEAKLIGAGGGGCVWVYAPTSSLSMSSFVHSTDAATYTAFCKSLPPSFGVYRTTLGGHGVQVASTDTPLQIPDTGDAAALADWWNRVYRA